MLRKILLVLSIFTFQIDAKRYVIDDIPGLRRIDSLYSIGNTLFINAQDGISEGSFYTITNGGPLTLIKHGDYKTGGPSEFFEVNGKFYYAYNDVSRLGHWTSLYNSLWVFDGTPQSSQKLADELVSEIRPVGNTIFFRKMDDANGFELWAYPVGGSSHMVKDISAGTPSSHPGNLTSFNGKVFFTATTPETGFELWTSDGTPNGTRLLKDINPGTRSAFRAAGVIWSDYTYEMQLDYYSFVEYNGEFYFVAQDGVHGQELWKSNGTEEGTVMVKDINPSGDALFAPSGYYYKPVMTVFKNKLYFVAYDPDHGAELWCTDGTEAGTQLVKDINPGVGSSQITELKEYNGYLYFPATSGPDEGVELWRTDGTTWGTVLFEDIMNHPLRSDKSSFPRELTVYDGRLYFAAVTALDREFCYDDPPYDCFPYFLEFCYLYSTDGTQGNLEKHYDFGSVYYLQKYLLTATSNGLYFKSYDANQLLHRLYPADNPPQFASNPPREGVVGTEWAYDVDAFDPDGQEVTISAVSIPSWLTLQPDVNGTASLYGTPTAPGEYTIILSASADGLSTEQTFTIYVKQRRIISLEVYNYDEQMYNQNFSVPRVTLVNNGPDTVTDVVVEYYFQTENNKVPVLQVFHPQTENIYLINVTAGVYKLVFNYIGKIIPPYSSYPDNSGAVVGLSYADWSTWNKYNDYSNNLQYSSTLNEKICVYTMDGILLFGTPPEFNSLPFADAGMDINIIDPQGAGETVSLNGSRSYDPDGTIVKYEWLYNGIVIGTTDKITYHFPTGANTVTLRVTDSKGGTATDIVMVNIMPYGTNIPFTLSSSVYSQGQFPVISYTVPPHIAGKNIVCHIQREWDTVVYPLPNSAGAQNKQA
ncbi:MAG: hypothetical protein GX640_20565, partial [Fibrobacter sp.]|nr:hypothetical protein [Fibrobacter sp.]